MSTIITIEIGLGAYSLGWFGAVDWASTLDGGIHLPGILLRCDGHASRSVKMHSTLAHPILSERKPRMCTYA